MWSPITETTAIKNNTTTTASDNNKSKEENEDCRCSGSGSSSSCLTQKQPQQQLNNLETNSKKQTSTFGGSLTSSNSTVQNIDFNNKKDKEFTSEAIDSGFISGPQNSNSSQYYDNSDELEEGAVSSGSSSTNINKFNIIAEQQQAPQQQQQQSKKETTILDSGCIDEEIDDFNDEEECENINAINKQTQQVQFETLNKNNNISTTNTNDPMILKQNVDAGMSEWFCNLSLQSDSTTNVSGIRSHAQMQQPQQVAGIGMNNLEAASARRSAAAVAALNSSTNNNNKSQQQAAGNTASQITPTNAWEKFYQQNDDGDTPLHLAIIWGYVDVVAALLRMAPHPCLFNIQNDEAQTPLHLAARTSQPTIIRMLLLAGAEPAIRDRDGNTALHLACTNGEIQCVRTLLEKFTASEIVEAHRQFGHLSNDKSISSLNYARLPSDLEIRNYDGERCVHLVARNGNIDILRLLVLHGADINAREGRSGLTPLHIAIECCNEKLANFLLDECEKLNVETATYAGLTAYQVACMLNKSQLQTMLENYGAEPLTPPDSDYDSSDIEDLDDSKFYDRFGDPGYFIGYSGGNPMTVV